MPLGREVGVGPGDKGAQRPNFRPMAAVANGRRSQLLLSTCSLILLLVDLFC